MQLNSFSNLENVHDLNKICRTTIVSHIDEELQLNLPCLAPNTNPL